MSDRTSTAKADVAALLTDLGARAAGLWRVDSERLVQVAFVPAPSLPEAVSRAFAEATRSVSLDQSSLGIVKAAVLGEVAVSRASELPADAGSGTWLRQFGAVRSVAVPLRDDLGSIRGVLAVALPDSPLDDNAVADRLRAAARVESWFS
jgi:hypothetical protein